MGDGLIVQHAKREMPPWYYGPWETPAVLRQREDAAAIECVQVLSGRWKPLADPYWDTCVIKVPFRVRRQEGDGAE